MTKEEITRFWSHVLIGPKQKCWVWKISKNGYPKFWTSKGIRSCSSISFELHYGIPVGTRNGECTLHKCDNPSCVNPNHLFLGTQKMNALDKSIKGRCNPNPPFGESHYLAKLNRSKVRKIRALYKTRKYTQRILAQMFDVSTTSICYIVNKINWKN